MKIYCLDPCKEDILIDNSCAACIGYFDGFHFMSVNVIQSV